ncbi:hypothetical protein BC332_19464 [Capsicum chinense]|nr:hypothetical protein BC332_19464 [Capsicum chinense]
MKTGDLYIALAYLGLQVVGPKGGLATPLVQKFEGKPLIFTNEVDIDDHDDVICFTDTSTKYQRRQFLAFFSSGDATGMKGLKLVLVAETSNFRILRINSKGELWVALQAISSVLSISDSESGKLPFTTQQMDEGNLHPTTMKLSEEGQVLEVLEDIEGKKLRSISQVEEKDGKLWFGSIVFPFLRVYGL